MNSQKNKIILLIIGIILVISIGIISYFVFNMFGQQESPVDTLMNSEEQDDSNNMENSLTEDSYSEQRGYEFVEAMESMDSTKALIARPLKLENRFIYIDKNTGEIRESKDYTESEYIGKISDWDSNSDEIYVAEKKFKNYIIFKNNNIFNIYNIKSNKNIEVPVEVGQVEINSSEDKAYFLFDKDSPTSQVYEYNFNTGKSELISSRQNIKWIEVSDNNLFYQASLNIYRYFNNKEYPLAQGLETISIKLGGLFNKAILEVDGVSYLYDYTNITVKLNQLGFFVDPKNVVWSDLEREFYTITEGNVYLYNWATQISTKTTMNLEYNGNKADLSDFDLKSMVSHNGNIYINNLEDNKIYVLMDMTNGE